MRSESSNKILCQTSVPAVTIHQKRFSNTLTGEHRLKWKCEACKSKEPKTDNSNTPVRTGHDDKVTHRRGATVQSPPDAVDDDLTLQEIRSLKEELLLFRQEMIATRQRVNEFNTNLTNLINRVENCELKTDQLCVRMDALEDTLKNVHKSEKDRTIEILKAELNDRDQQLLLNDIEITGVLEQKEESLEHIVLALANKLSVKLDQQDIVSALRVGSVVRAESDVNSSRPRPIVVRLVRRAKRDELLKAARVRRGATTEGIGLQGSPRRFYLNERLTKINRFLFRQARQAKERLNWRYVWTRDGKIFARQHSMPDSPLYRLHTNDDLVRVFGQEAFGS
ncbi:hypothetical protein ACJJTC_005571 [Scirpophaga incertulas]